MAYWVLHEGQIVGPYLPSQLGELPDFGPETLVCPESASRGPVSRWLQAVAVDELREALLERRRRSRYWAYLSGRIIGPVPASQLWDLEGFDSSVPVCLEGETGRRRWAVAGDLPELTDMMPAPAGPRVGVLPPSEAPELGDLKKLPAEALAKFLETAERANYAMFRETQRKMDSLERSVRDLRSELSARVELGALRRSLDTLQEQVARQAGLAAEAGSPEAVAKLREDQKALEDNLAALREAVEQGQGAAMPPAPRPSVAPASPPPAASAALSSLGAEDLGFGGLSLGDDSLSLGGSLGGLGDSAEGGLSLGLSPAQPMESALPPTPAPEPPPPFPATAVTPALALPALSSSEPASIPTPPATDLPAPAPEPSVQLPVLAPISIPPAEPPVLPPALAAPEEPLTQTPESVPALAAALFSGPTPDSGPQLPVLQPLPAPAAAAAPAEPALPPLPSPPPVEPASTAPAAAPERISRPSMRLPALDRRAVLIGAAAAAFLGGLLWMRHPRRPASRGVLAAAAPALPTDEQSAIDAVRLRRLDETGKTVGQTLSSLAPPDESSGRWAVTRGVDGFDVTFAADRVDPENGQPLVYRFHVAGGAVSGENMPARAILQEP